MRILIAEAKTMAACTEVVSPEVWRKHRPLFDSEASELMARWAECPAGRIASELKLSPSLSASVKRMAYEFANKASGCKAIRAYTGVVFKALDYPTLDAGEQIWADSRIDIISSLYGFLRPDDIVKPYRLDFNTKAAPTGQSMAAYWKPRVTPALLASLRATGETELLNLLPADAEKCIDWTVIGQSVMTVKVEFRSLNDGGSVSTPHATLLKTLRGLLLRDIIKRDIRSLDELRTYESTTMCADPEANADPGKIVIVC